MNNSVTPDGLVRCAAFSSPHTTHPIGARDIFYLQVFGLTPAVSTSHLLVHDSNHQFRSTLLPSLLWTKTRRVALYPHGGCHIISLPHHMKCITNMKKFSFWHFGIWFSHIFSPIQLQEDAVDNRPSNLSTSSNLLSNQQPQWSALLASMRCWTVPRCCGSWCHDGMPSKKRLRTGEVKHDLTSKEQFGHLDSKDEKGKDF